MLEYCEYCKETTAHSKLNGLCIVCLDDKKDEPDPILIPLLLLMMYLKSFYEHFI